MRKIIELTLNTENLYVTSDLHLNHRNIIKYCNRPWEYNDKGVEEMNTLIIHNLMSLPECSTLLNLGDWALLRGSNKNRILVHNVIENLLKKNISIITVLGNHDRLFRKTQNSDGSFIETEELNKVYLQEYENALVKSIWFSGLEKILLNGKYYLTHEPFFLREKEKLQIHGHVHNSPLHREGEWKSNVNDKMLENYINACADVHDFKPVLFAELVGGQ